MCLSFISPVHIFTKQDRVLRFLKVSVPCMTVAKLVKEDLIYSKNLYRLKNNFIDKVLEKIKFACVPMSFSRDVNTLNSSLHVFTVDGKTSSDNHKHTYSRPHI